MGGADVIDYLIAAVVLGFWPVVLVARAYLVKAHYRKKLAPLAAAFSGELNVGVWDGYFVTFINESLEAKIRLITTGKNTPPYLVIVQAGELDFDFRITEESSATRALDKYGLVHDLQVGESAFDDQYLIRSSHRGQTQVALADPARQEAVEHFTSRGFDEINYKDRLLIVFKPHYQDADLGIELIKEHLAKMVTLVGKA